MYVNIFNFKDLHFSGKCNYTNVATAFTCVNVVYCKWLCKPTAFPLHRSQQAPKSERVSLPMASSDAKPSFAVLPASLGAPGCETYRTKSIATRLTEAESAATSAGKNVSEWLRSVALIQARSEGKEHTDPILLGEILGMRALMLNLFAKASEGPLSKDDLRKISEYADAVKHRKADTPWCTHLSDLAGAHSCHHASVC